MPSSSLLSGHLRIFHIFISLFQYFTTNHKGKWKFPVYYGACGRVVIVENGGIPLERYITAPWETRAALSLQLLKIVEDFVASTFNLVAHCVGLTISRGNQGFLALARSPELLRPIWWSTRHRSKSAQSVVKYPQNVTDGIPDW
jgi:hypothetical protein